MVSHMVRGEVFCCRFTTLAIGAEHPWAILRHRLHTAQQLEATDGNLVERH